MKCLFCFLVSLVFSPGMLQDLESKRKPHVYIIPGNDLVIASVGETAKFTCAGENLPERYNLTWMEQINRSTLRWIGGINSTISNVSSLNYKITENTVKKLSCVLEYIRDSDMMGSVISSTANVTIVGTEDTSKVYNKPPETLPVNIKTNLSLVCDGQNLNYDSNLIWYQIKDGHPTELTSNHSKVNPQVKFYKILDEDDNSTIVYCEQHYETLAIQIRSTEWKISLNKTPSSQTAAVLTISTAAEFPMKTDSFNFLEKIGTSSSYIGIISAVGCLIAIILLAAIIYCWKNHCKKKEPIYTQPREGHYVILQLPPSSAQIIGQKDMPPYVKIVGVINPKKKKKISAESETSKYA